MFLNLGATAICLERTIREYVSNQKGIYRKFQGFTVVSEVPELYRKLRAACRKSYCYMLSKSELVVPSDDKKKQKH